MKAKRSTVSTQQHAALIQFSTSSLINAVKSTSKLGRDFGLPALQLASQYSYGETKYVFSCHQADTDTMEV